MVIFINQGLRGYWIKKGKNVFNVTAFTIIIL